MILGDSVEADDSVPKVWWSDASTKLLQCEWEKTYVAGRRTAPKSATPVLDADLFER